MPVPANMENYTVPGGIKLFFNTGTGERDLGNIMELDLEPGTEELEHYTNRSGARRKDKVITLEEKLTLKFKLDEPVIEHLQYFFKGGDITAQGAGTANAEVKAVLTGVGFVSLGAYYGLSAVTVRQFLDRCFLQDASAGGTFVDNSAEADSLGGTAFEIIAEADDKLYLMKATPFTEVYFDFGTPGEYTGVAFKYWNGTEWTAVSNLTGAAAALAADGKATWDLPAGWTKTTINGYNGYAIEITATAVTTAALVNSIRQDAVVNVDYVLDAGSAGAEGRQDGRIARLAGGFLADGEEVKAAFTYTTWTALKMPIAASAFVEGAARLEMHPTEGRGLKKDFVFPKTMLKPQGAISFDDKKWMEVPLSLEVLDNSEVTPDTPYGYILDYDV